MMASGSVLVSAPFGANPAPVRDVASAFLPMMTRPLARHPTPKAGTHASHARNSCRKPADPSHRSSHQVSRSALRRTDKSVPFTPPEVVLATQVFQSLYQLSSLLYTAKMAAPRRPSIDAVCVLCNGRRGALTVDSGDRYVSCANSPNTKTELHSLSAGNRGKMFRVSQ